MDQWLTDNLLKFQSIYMQYNQSEAALCSCAMTMMKILNGLSEMAYTKFHRYEKKMLWTAMELFSKQCIQQIQIALECSEVERKREYIVDIESSISEMTDVYKNIMGGVSNAERQMFQSLSVDIKIHDLSPKLCAFYSSILEAVVTMFKENGMEYAFVLHPVLHSTIEAKVLLEKREQSGKVVIIYVSENVIEEFDLVSICLLHEAFHVLTKSERMRSNRARCFLLQMVEQMGYQIFHDVSFRRNDPEIKEMLLKYWFREVKEQLMQFGQRAEDDKGFYARQIAIEIENKVKEYLRDVDTDAENVIMDTISQSKGVTNYSNYLDQAHDAEKNSKKIRRNIFYIVSENLIAEIAERIMFIYRETYADIACILLLQLRPELYQNAFLNSIQFQHDTTYVDDAKMLRESLVATVVSREICTELKEPWKHYADSLNGEIGRQEKSEESHLSSEIYRDIIKINSNTRKMYEDYLIKCASALSMRLQNINGIIEFRKRMDRVITGDYQQLLKSILSGDAVMSEEWQTT